MDKRLEALRKWVDTVLDGCRYRLRPASADASFRRYFRVFAGADIYIAMDAPPDTQDCAAYVRIAKRFRQLGLNVPQVLHSDTNQGFLLISDLGDRSYLSCLSEATVENLYADAFQALLILQRNGVPDSDFLPGYDEGLLLSELRIFQEWYLGRHLGLRLTTTQEATLDRVFTRLKDSALEQPRVWVHRDFHSRNLMMTEENNPGILDFQDAVSGPVTYDLVSLLRDCYISWPYERVERWVHNYYTLAHDAGVPVGEDEDQFRQWFERMGVQRHLKATGIFARLKYRDRKPAYIIDIPRTLRYVRDASSRCGDLQLLHELLWDVGVWRTLDEAEDR
ncbi:MAG: aminoglycoside phosphotransferase family protein [Acidiferrobacterales bacterium]